MDREFASLGMRLLQYALLFVGTLVVARALGPSGRAQYALPFALSGGVWVVTNLTVDGAAGRLIGRGEASPEDVTGVLVACAGALALCGVAVTLVVGWVGRESLLRGAGAPIVFVSAFSIPGLLATQIAGYVLLLQGRVKLYAGAALAAAAAQLAVVVVIVLAGAMTPLPAACATTGGFLVSGALMVAAVARSLGLGALVPRVERAVLCDLLRVSAAIHPMSIAIQLGPRLELLIVGAMASSQATGLYSLALTLAQMPMFAVWSLAQAGVGPMTALEQDEAVAYGCEFTRQATLVGVTIAAGVSVVAFPFVELAYGPAWRGALVPLVILLAGTVALAVENPLRALLLRVASPVALAAVAAAAVALNAGLTVALIGPFGIVGAAAASLLAYWGFAAGMIVLLARAAPGAPLRRSVRRLSGEDWVLAAALAHVRRLRALVRSLTEGAAQAY